MYHESSFFSPAYYDTIEELPNTIKVIYPKEDGGETVNVTPKELLAIGDNGYYFIEHSVNYGCCDHWSSRPLYVFVEKYFNKIIEYTRNGRIIGYNRKGISVLLTRDANYRQSEVWNS